MSLKVRIHNILTLPDPHHGMGRVINLSMAGLILANVAAVAAESVPAMAAAPDWMHGLHVFDTVSVAIFTVEYLLRLWTCTAAGQYAHPLWGRLLWAVTPLALIDLLAIAPYYVQIVVHHETVDLRFIRLLRVVRILRLLKLTRHSEALQLLWRVVYAKRFELVNSVMLLAMLVVLAASLAYVFEHGAVPERPDHFAGIPEAMWWAVVTLTTVGYGDVVPVTVPGRIIAGFTAACGIAMFALPTAVLGAAYLSEAHAAGPTARRDDTAAAASDRPTAASDRPAAAVRPAVCPHCGREIVEPAGG